MGLAASVVTFALTIGASTVVAADNITPLLGSQPAGNWTTADAFVERELRRILRMSPLPELPPDPSNRVAEDAAAVAFGKRLFFDRRLSGKRDISCATCHNPEQAWADGRRASNPNSRFPKNAPSLWNNGFNRWYYWDGRADSAWAQALGPIESPQEMAGNRLAAIHVVHEDPKLAAAYSEIFGPWPSGLDDPTRFPPAARPSPKDLEDPLQRAWASISDVDRQTANRIFSNLGKAIAAFERTLVFADTPFDRFVASLRRGDGSTDLKASAVRGLKLFIGRGQCTLCHSGPNLSDGEFHDIGIAIGPDSDGTLRVDPGRHRGVYKLLRSPFTRIGQFADAPTPGAPVEFLQQRGHQLGQFKTPQLRNVANTAPYMHDGRFRTLEEVVRFYSTRTGAKPLGHPTTLLQPLNLNDGEVADLVAFLQALSGSGD